MKNEDLADCNHDNQYELLFVADGTFSIVDDSIHGKRVYVSGIANETDALVIMEAMENAFGHGMKYKVQQIKQVLLLDPRHVTTKSNVNCKDILTNMFEYKTTIGQLYYDDKGVEQVDDPIPPTNDTNWELVSSCLGELQYSVQPIFWFWRLKIDK